MADEAAQNILDKLIYEITEETILPALIQEKKLRGQFGKASVQLPKDGKLTTRILPVQRIGVDIYGQEKSTDIKYFQCSLCERQVAGNRFAAHVAKCVTRGRRQRANFT